MRHLSMQKEYLRLAAAALVGLLCCACDSKTVEQKPMSELPLKAAQTLDKNTEYGKWWTDRPALFKLSDTMLLQIPPIYQGFWAQRNNVTRAPADLSKLPTVSQVGFVFFMPDFTGYTPQNYERDFDEDRVDVISIEYVGMGQAQAGAPGAFPPNMFKRAVEYQSIDLENYQEKYDLRCYAPRPSQAGNEQCYGIRDATRSEYMWLRTMVPPESLAFKYPLMQAHYFTPKYGGVEILWRANMKHFPRWHDIDSQIWKFIDSWNLNNPVNQTKP